MKQHAVGTYELILVFVKDIEMGCKNRIVQMPEGRMFS